MYGMMATPTVSLETATKRMLEIESLRRKVWDYGDEDIMDSTLWCGIPDGATFGEVLDYLLYDEDDSTYKEWLRVYKRALEEIENEDRKALIYGAYEG